MKTQVLIMLSLLSLTINDYTYGKKKFLEKKFLAYSDSTTTSKPEVPCLKSSVREDIIKTLGENFRRFQRHVEEEASKEGPTSQDSYDKFKNNFNKNVRHTDEILDKNPKDRKEVEEFYKRVFESIYRTFEATSYIQQKEVSTDYEAKKQLNNYLKAQNNLVKKLQSQEKNIISAFFESMKNKKDPNNQRDFFEDSKDDINILEETIGKILPEFVILQAKWQRHFSIEIDDLFNANDEWINHSFNVGNSVDMKRMLAQSTKPEKSIGEAMHRLFDKATAEFDETASAHNIDRKEIVNVVKPEINHFIEKTTIILEETKNEPESVVPKFTKILEKAATEVEQAVESSNKNMSDEDMAKLNQVLKTANLHLNNVTSEIDTNQKGQRANNTRLSNLLFKIFKDMFDATGYYMQKHHPNEYEDLKNSYEEYIKAQMPLKDKLQIPFNKIFNSWYDAMELPYEKLGKSMEDNEEWQKDYKDFSQKNSGTITKGFMSLVNISYDLPKSSKPQYDQRHEEVNKLE